MAVTISMQNFITKTSVLFPIFQVQILATFMEIMKISSSVNVIQLHKKTIISMKSVFALF